jgi:hypothetical protein
MSSVEPVGIVRRIRAEFLEMPGLQLTPPQAARLWGLDVMSCDVVIGELMRSAVLRWTHTGRIARAEE